MIKKTGMILIAALILMNCGGGDTEATKEAAAPKLSPDGLTQEQLKHGIGPIGVLTLGPQDEVLAAKGAEVFELKCVACHKINERLVGPPLAGITTKRSPAFIMNMILNPDEMVKKHPEVKAMLAEFYVPMTFQNVTEDDARAILEYLRTL
ncbi:MAG: cytochrome c [Candidatus Marinimicrobia bacterium]|jgi:mono/diheme cytochrome c family protein|nr:cytochrome c [Candidatus Neomarinimicrobiota bacterium]MBT3576832.1 cytochrome c [Candidatus Neomarinimicrobiota bacterium]MBT3679040.1 cytochrome c [Candidatus Neomarinimicrobiota bacterium]MBT3950297.1 cytochrome c [Candidatus Neomarinimicrobiota bacterium]MBT4252089.1 cytochrome c [Candidatus Neomarinimicrobiota bacterium]